ncbi:hypothetical protein EGW08_021395 [Elysia chlorotica]|uniref:HAUS augmin-like complex subunit 1 n=1 Tax=Elysia chlorotica TaxID=188477 RepID=A0A433SNX0_ELYCH|nr:hypothetical protein EGW08_021395 [Elysia chlorotica]
MESTSFHLADQKQKVMAWLHDLFGNEQVPDFEINKQTIEYLHQLSQDSQQHDRHLQLVTTDFKQKTSEYSAEAKRLSGNLQRLQIHPENLTAAGINSLTALTKLGMHLDVKDATNTSYMLGLQDLEDELEKVGEEAEEESGELKKLTKSYRQILLQCSSLQKVLDGAKIKQAEDSELNAKKKHETSFYLQKEQNYKKEIRKMESQLANTKIESSLFHENLVKKAEVLKDIQGQLEPLRAELQAYSVLPPDLDAAKIKLAEYQIELEKLDKQLLDCIGNTMM